MPRRPAGRPVRRRGPGAASGPAAPGSEGNRAGLDVESVELGEEGHGSHDWGQPARPHDLVPDFLARCRGRRPIADGRSAASPSRRPLYRERLSARSQRRSAIMASVSVRARLTAAITADDTEAVASSDADLVRAALAGDRGAF